MSKQYLCMKEIIIIDLQQGLLGNKFGSGNFIRGLSQATQRLYGDLSLSTASASLFFPSFPLPVLSSGGSVVKKKKKKSACQCWRHRFNPWVGKIPCSRKWQATPVLLAWKSPWTEEPSGLESMELQRVRHN